VDIFVRRMGGAEQITLRKQWSQLGRILGIDMTTTTAVSILKKAYLSIMRIGAGGGGVMSFQFAAKAASERWADGRLGAETRGGGAVVKEEGAEGKQQKVDVQTVNTCVAGLGHEGGADVEKADAFADSAQNVENVILYISTRLCTCDDICMYIYTYTHEYMYLYICIYYTYTPQHMYMDICIYMLHMYIYVHIYICIYIYTYIYTHI